MEESEAEKRVHTDLAFLVLENVRFDELHRPRVIALDLSLPGWCNEELSQGLDSDSRSITFGILLGLVGGQAEPLFKSIDKRA